MNKKIKIHITDGDFALHNQELIDTDIITTGSAYGRFILVSRWRGHNCLDYGDSC